MISGMKSFIGVLYFSFQPKKYLSLWIQVGICCMSFFGSKTKSLLFVHVRSYFDLLIVI